MARSRDGGGVWWRVHFRELAALFLYIGGARYFIEHTLLLAVCPILQAAAVGQPPLAAGDGAAIWPHDVGRFANGTLQQLSPCQYAILCEPLSALAEQHLASCPQPMRLLLKATPPVLVPSVMLLLAALATPLLVIPLQGDLHLAIQTYLLPALITTLILRPAWRRRPVCPGRRHLVLVGVRLLELASMVPWGYYPPGTLRFNALMVPRVVAAPWKLHAWVGWQHGLLLQVPPRWQLVLGHLELVLCSYIAAWYSRLGGVPPPDLVEQLLAWALAAGLPTLALYWGQGSQREQQLPAAEEDNQGEQASSKAPAVGGSSSSMAAAGVGGATAAGGSPLQGAAAGGAGSTQQHSEAGSHPGQPEAAAVGGGPVPAAPRHRAYRSPITTASLCIKVRLPGGQEQRVAEHAALDALEGLLQHNQQQLLCRPMAVPGCVLLTAQVMWQRHQQHQQAAGSTACGSELLAHQGGAWAVALPEPPPAGSNPASAPPPAGVYLECDQLHQVPQVTLSGLAALGLGLGLAPHHPGGVDSSCSAPAVLATQCSFAAVAAVSQPSVRLAVASMAPGAAAPPQASARSSRQAAAQEPVQRDCVRVVVSQAGTVLSDSRSCLAASSSSREQLQLGWPLVGRQVVALGSEQPCLQAAALLVQLHRCSSRGVAAADPSTVAHPGSQQAAGGSFQPPSSPSPSSSSSRTPNSSRPSSSSGLAGAAPAQVTLLLLPEAVAAELVLLSDTRALTVQQLEQLVGDMGLLLTARYQLQAALLSRRTGEAAAAAGQASSSGGVLPHAQVAGMARLAIIAAEALTLHLEGLGGLGVAVDLVLQVKQQVLVLLQELQPFRAGGGQLAGAVAPTPCDTTRSAKPVAAEAAAAAAAPVGGSAAAAVVEAPAECRVMKLSPGVSHPGSSASSGFGGRIRAGSGVGSRPAAAGGGVEVGWSSVLAGFPSRAQQQRYLEYKAATLQRQDAVVAAMHLLGLAATWGKVGLMAGVAGGGGGQAFASAVMRALVVAVGTLPFTLVWTAGRWQQRWPLLGRVLLWRGVVLQLYPVLMMGLGQVCCWRGGVWGAGMQVVVDAYYAAPVLLHLWNHVVQHLLCRPSPRESLVSFAAIFLWAHGLYGYPLLPRVGRAGTLALTAGAHVVVVLLQEGHMQSSFARAQAGAVGPR